MELGASTLLNVEIIPGSSTRLEVVNSQRNVDKTDGWKVIAIKTVIQLDSPLIGQDVIRTNEMTELRRVAASDIEASSVDSYES